MNNVFERNGKLMLLAYDQGFEHGPVDFNEDNIDPQYVVDLADSGFFTGVIFHEGVAAKYYNPLKHNVPLIIKLNGKTSFRAGEEPYSPQLCTIQKAVELGAKGVGYTIYVGSEREAEMMAEFSRLEDEAHRLGMTVIAWMYPRGKKVEGKESDKDVVAYAARLGLELNADFVKVPYTGTPESFKWVVESAGKTGVLAQGGNHKSWDEFGKEAQEIMSVGAKGMAVGRNIWQDEKPLDIAEKLSKVIFE